MPPKNSNFIFRTSTSAFLRTLENRNEKTRQCLLWQGNCFHKKNERKTISQLPIEIFQTKSKKKNYSIHTQAYFQWSVTNRLAKKRGDKYKQFPLIFLSFFLSTFFIMPNGFVWLTADIRTLFCLVYSKIAFRVRFDQQYLRRNVWNVRSCKLPLICCYHNTLTVCTRIQSREQGSESKRE